MSYVELAKKYFKMLLASITKAVVYAQAIPKKLKELNFVNPAK